MIDCGIPYYEIINKLNEYNLDILDIKFVLVSHKHKDHSLSIKPLINKGFKVYVNEDTKEYLLNNFKLTNYEIDNLKVLKAYKEIKIDNIKIKSFEVLHDCYNLGFIISIDRYNLLYATDFSYLDYKALNFIKKNKYKIALIECNYDNQTLIDNLDNNKIDNENYVRIIRYHASLFNITSLLQLLGNINLLILIHLSSRNSNEELIANETLDKLKMKNVFICKKGGGMMKYAKYDR